VRKFEFKESVPSFVWRESGNLFRKNHPHYTQPGLNHDIAVIGSLKDTRPGQENTDPSNMLQVYFWWVLGIVLLTVALFVSARMGIYQEVLYAKYGKHPREALFYTHLLPLPGFLIWYQSIVEHAGFLAQSEPFAIPILGFGLPKLYIYLICNVLTHVKAMTQTPYL
ncbi:unnamed protein product, partial [Timema podura]|nr:unnamed protein product [Timema podura]